MKKQIDLIIVLIIITLCIGCPQDRTSSIDIESPSMDLSNNMYIDDESYPYTSMKLISSKSFTIKGSNSDGVFVTGRTVKLGSYWMMKYDVTQKLYKKVWENSSITYNSEFGAGENYPAYGVSWYDAIAFCNKLSILMGRTPCYSVKGVTDWSSLSRADVPDYDNADWNAVTVNMSANGYRLPTEAEWEWAADAGEGHEYPGSNTLTDVAWFGSNSNNAAHPVGLKSPNSLGLYDMAGNVFEWCWDIYSEDVTAYDSAYMTNGIVTNPLGATDEIDSHVIRGGWHSSSSLYQCSVTSRGCGTHNYNRGIGHGLRLVCSASGYDNSIFGVTTTSSTTTSTTSTTSTTVPVKYTTVHFYHYINATGFMKDVTFDSYDSEGSLTPYKLPYSGFTANTGYEFYAWSVEIGSGNPRLYQPGDYIMYSSLTDDFLFGTKVIYVTAIYQSKSTTTTSIEEAAAEDYTPQYFWGTWVKMSDGVEYNIYETECEYQNTIGYMSSCTDTTMTISGLGTFTKQSDSVMIMDNIPYYRKGGANLEYKVRVVGFSDSRSGGTFGQANKRVTGKSKKYTSNVYDTTTNSEGVATLIAPVAYDTQTVSVDAGDNTVVSADIEIGATGGNMGTIAIVDKDQPNLKVTGEIIQSTDQSEDAEYLYADKTYNMTLTIKNISEVLSKTSIVTVVSDNPNLTVAATDGTNLSSGIVVGSLAAGGTKTFSLNVTCTGIERGHIDTGLKITINNVLDNQIWEDYVPMRFFKEKTSWTITAKNPDNNNDAILKGFIIYPDGNNQYFTVANNGVKTIEVPQFNLDEQYLMVFCGANANTGLYSTEMHYTVVCGNVALPIDEDVSGIAAKITFGESNDNQDSAYTVDRAFQAYLHAGDIDYYHVTANDNNIITVTLDNQSADTSGTESISGMIGTALPDITIPVKVGYGFKGYWTEQNGDGIQYINADGTGARVLTFTEDKTLYVKWNIAEYTIVYDNNGGSGSMETQQMTYNVSADLKSGISFSKTGYTFLGWDLDQNAAEPTWTAYQTVSNLTTIDGATVRLYAVWQPHSYIVAFDANGGTGDAMSEQSMIYGTPTSLSACTFTKDGYSFAGWSRTQNADVAEYADGETVTDVSVVNGDYVTLYAVWGVNYTVHFDANGGEGSMNDQGMIGGKDVLLQENTFTRARYSFVGWATNPDTSNVTYLDAEKVRNLTLIANDTVVLYAVWRINAYINDVGNIVINDVEYPCTSFISVIDSVTTVIGADSNWSGYLINSAENYFKGVFINGRTVHLSPYNMSQYEVTQQLYENVMNENINFDKGDGDCLPAYYVSWYDAIVFCNKLSLIMGKHPCYSIDGITDWIGLRYSNIPTESNDEWDNVTVNIDADGYRLPTETEWEFAARGGDPKKADWKYAFSGINSVQRIYKEQSIMATDDNLILVGWYYQNSSYNTHHVGIKNPNRLGLYDMSGNIKEWCTDWYNDSIMTGISMDPIGDEFGLKRCQRGGNCLTEAYGCLVSYRSNGDPCVRSYISGIRLVYSVR